ncbi:MAG: hypothetical protein P4M00_08880 [Azospirillaceae bacterium]|nr:hypothetical protein [Azospirillaceae bacterium]
MGSQEHDKTRPQIEDKAETEFAEGSPAFLERRDALRKMAKVAGVIPPAMAAILYSRRALALSGE